MKIATFNINGIKARLGALTDWLEEAQPDVAVLQEIKSEDQNFPREVFEDKGYNVETHGQKTPNGPRTWLARSIHFFGSPCGC